MRAASSFDKHRMDAVRAFAQTIIMVDDEAKDEAVGAQGNKPKKANTPKKGVKYDRNSEKTQNTGAVNDGDGDGKKHSDTHPLHRNKVVEAALNLGLVCAVVNPPDDSPEVIDKIAKSSERADIVSLDWQMHKDDGRLAVSTIKEILRRDAKKNGRLRLIAIYTGVKDYNLILNTVRNGITDLDTELIINEDARELVGSSGFKVVYLYKSQKSGLAEEDTSAAKNGDAEEDTSAAKNGDAEEDTSAANNGDAEEDTSAANNGDAEEDTSAAKNGDAEEDTSAAKNGDAEEDTSAANNGDAEEDTSAANNGDAEEDTSAANNGDAEEDTSAANNGVAEEDLPAVLLNKFSKMSEGILSNVAMTAIAAVRDATHHVIGKFKGDMDGPYFQHRAIINEPSDAQEYAIEVVMSELKSSINKMKIANEVAGSSAVACRIEELSDEKGDFRFPNDVNISEKIRCITLSSEEVIDIVIKGLNSFQLPRGIRHRAVKPFLGSLFASDLDASCLQSQKFSALTSISSHPGNNVVSAPNMKLGTIIKSRDDCYYICLQAVCDANPQTHDDYISFFMIPLSVVELGRNALPDHVIPIAQDEFIGLNMPEKAIYSKVVPIKFNQPKEDEDRRICAKYDEENSMYSFVDYHGIEYYWVANLKQRRAIRMAQRIGQQLARIGYDEFEPFRKENK